MFFSVLQNEARRPQPEVLYRVFRGKCKCVFSPVLSTGFSDFAHENTENRCFYPVLPNESDSKTVINFNVMVSRSRF